MTPKNPINPKLLLLLLAFFCLSSCTPVLEYHAAEMVRSEDHSEKYLGSYFPSFQQGFLNILLFLFLFTIFQCSQNRRKDYFCYAIYLFISWLYFARAFPDYFSPLFFSAAEFTAFSDSLKTENGLNDQTEFMFFCFLTTGYLLFAFTFFNLKEEEPLGYKITRYTIFILLASAFIQIVVLLVTKGTKFLLGPPEIAIKTIYATPAVWLMAKIIRTKLPGATYIVIGSSALLLGGIFVGILHLIGDPHNGKRVFLQVGVLIEILFFSAALGRKEFDVQLRLSSTKQENNQITQEKQGIEQEKRLVEQRTNRLRSKLRRQIDKNRDLQKKLEKRFNGNNSLKLKPAADETFTEKLERVLAQNYTRSDFNVPELADLMQLEQQTLNRRIKQQYNVSTKTYLCHYRIDKSKELMLDQYLKLRDIAAKVGFNQYEHYSNSLTKKEGISPQKFRRKLLGGS